MPISFPGCRHDSAAYRRKPDSADSQHTSLHRRQLVTLGRLRLQGQHGLPEFYYRLGRTAALRGHKTLSVRRCCLLRASDSSAARSLRPDQESPYSPSRATVGWSCGEREGKDTVSVAGINRDSEEDHSVI